MLSYPARRRRVRFVLSKIKRERCALDDDEAAARFEAGVEHTTRWYEEGSADDRLSAIDHLRATRHLIDAEDPARGVVAALLGPLLSQQIAANLPTTAESVDEALAELELALACDNEPVVDLFVRHHRAFAHTIRYLTLGGPDSDLALGLAELPDLLKDDAYVAEFGDAARILLIQLHMASLWPPVLRDSLDLPDADAVERLLYASTARSSEHLDEAMRAVSGYLAELSDEAVSHPDLAGALALLRSAAFVQTLGSVKRVEDLDAAIATVDEGLPSATDDAERALLTSLRAALFTMRARASKTTEDADAAIGVAEEGLAALDDTMPFAEHMRDLITIAATPLRGSTPVTDNDVAAAIERLRRVLERMPDDDARASALTEFTSELSGKLMGARHVGGLRQLRELVKSSSDNSTAGEVRRGVLRHLHGMLSGSEGVQREDTALISSAIDDVRSAAAMLPDDHPLKNVVDAFVSSLLTSRSVTSASLADLEAAQEIMRSRTGSDSADPRTRRLVKSVAALGEIMTKAAEFKRTFDIALLDDVIEQVRGLDPELGETVGAGGLPSVGDLERLREMLQQFEDPALAFRAMRQSVARGPTLERPDSVQSAMLMVNDGFVGHDLARLDQGIAFLSTAAENAGADNPRERVKLIDAIGFGLMLRYLRSRNRTDLSNAIARLEQAVHLAEGMPGLPGMASLHYSLGNAYHDRGDDNRRDRSRAMSSGLAALRERAEEVLLQADPRLALIVAESAADEATTVVRWCLAAGRDDFAVRALEIGRALVLHSISVESTIPDLLAEIGQHELAERWRRESAGTADTPEFTLGPLRVGGPDVPSDLRYRVLTEISGTKAESLLHTPPSPDEIAAALRRTGNVALVYLLPGRGKDPGLALVVRADATVESVRLPQLDCVADGPIEVFEQARRALSASPGDEGWRPALDDVCDWAWRVAFETVLSQLRGARAPKIVLVPVGRLGAVPWHAARRPVGRGVRYACQDTVITYAASARQFVDAARRQHPAWDDAAALVWVEDDSLRWTRREIESVQKHCYPGSTRLDGEVRAGDILAHLPSDASPGASVLHLSCHAGDATPPVDSRLVLSGEVLPVRAILRQARHRPADAPGGLVVLAACASDLTDGTHDEALTLSTAFLAAGAVGAVGARWPIVDLPTAFFMIMFHHHLTHGYADPAVALRVTQLWMLNPDRRLPAGVAKGLAEPMRRADLTDADSWAAFTYQGR